MGNEATYFPSKTRCPRGFHTNARLKIKSTAKFRKMYLYKTKKALISIRRQKCGAHLKVFLACEKLKIYFKPLRRFKFDDLTSPSLLPAFQLKCPPYACSLVRSLPIKELIHIANNAILRCLKFAMIEVH